jgi:hypothetical protein
LGVPLLTALGLYHFRGQRRLRAFFGIGDGRRGMVQIWLSNVQVKETGTVSAVPIRATLTVSAILAGEYRYALTLAGTIQSRPFIGALYALLEQLGVRTIEPPVNCQISPSLSYIRRPAISTDDAAPYQPVDFDTDDTLVAEIERALRTHTSFVLVGSQVYNVLTYYALTHCRDEARVEFSESTQEPGYQATALKVKGYLKRSEHIFERRAVHDPDEGYLYEEYFVVQKLRNWPKAGTTMFLCAGTSTAATAAALQTLADWKRLLRDFGTEPFAAVYCVRTDDRELPGTDYESSPNWSMSRVWCYPDAR